VTQKDLRLHDIRKDDSAQPRAMLNTDHIKDLADALEGGADLTPVDVFFDGRSYWLADGFHRWSAYHRAKRDFIPATIHEGDLRDAVLYSITANTKHSVLKMTREEKRASVTRLLKDEEWGQWSDREIGRRAGVHHETVGKVRAELSGENRQIERKVRRGDSEYTVQTAKINGGREREEKAVDASQSDVSEFTRERYAKTYSPPPLPDADEAEDDMLPEEVDDVESETGLEPYRPPYPMPEAGDLRVKPDDLSKRRPFIQAFTAAGALSNLSDDVIVAGLLSPENQTPEKDALETEFRVVVEKINRCMARAEIERKTVTA
jgi:ParB-like chromosome segregation protein Spo0J